MAYTDEFGNIFGSAEDFANAVYKDPSGNYTYDYSWIFSNTPDNPWTEGEVFDWGGANQESLGQLFSRYGREGFDFLKSIFKKQDGSIDWEKIATIGGGVLGLLNRNDKPATYQKPIPQYTAVRQAVPQAYDPNRRPGSGGQRYFTDVQYVPKTGSGAAEALTAAQTTAGEQATGLAALNAANPLNAPPPVYQPPAPPAQTTQPTPVYNPEYSGENVLRTVQGLLGTQNMARGGIVGLQDGGFVVPADVVSHLGNGSSRAGLAHLQRKGAVPIQGQGDGMSDSIRTAINNRQPAAVADGEAYLPPNRVQQMGGPERLYAMMDRIRKDRTGTAQQGRQINPNKYLG